MDKDIGVCGLELNSVVGISCSEEGPSLCEQTPSCLRHRALGFGRGLFRKQV